MLSFDSGEESAIVLGCHFFSFTSYVDFVTQNKIEPGFLVQFQSLVRRDLPEPDSAYLTKARLVQVSQVERAQSFKVIKKKMPHFL